MKDFFSNPFLYVATIALIGGLIGFLEKILPPPPRGKKKKVLFPSLAFSIIVISSIFTYFIGTTGKDNAKTQAIKIDSLNNIITTKEDRIEQLQNETINQFTAGKSKPQLTLIHEDANTIDVYLIDTSKYAIRNVTVSIDNIIKSSKLDSGHRDIKDSVKRQKAIDKDLWRYATIGKSGMSFVALVPRQLNFVKQIKSPPNTGINLRIDVVWPDGFYTYELQCDRVKEGYLLNKNECTDQTTGKKFPCKVDQNFR